MAAGLRRWRDTPRSRWTDAIYVNAAALFLLRIGNAVLRPSWRRFTGLFIAVILLQATHTVLSTALPRATPQTLSPVLAALDLVGRPYVDLANPVRFAGCLALMANVLSIAAYSLWHGSRRRGVGGERRRDAA
ncbi:hypothetical protein [Dactylosporangium sp. NPDC048998]|uniref:hypothetical protein n=1 Tax=Dactylosporangium sp. NPDC048998 TaxID=3363976 RepID=UPI003723EA52